MDIESRDNIKVLIDKFYQHAIEDDEIGFFFTEIAQLDFESHMPIMYDFWESVLLGGNSYKRNPIEVHTKLNSLHRIEKKHFDRWVQLFSTTVDELYSGPNAELAKTRANSISMIIQSKIASYSG